MNTSKVSVIPQYLIASILAIQVLLSIILLLQFRSLQESITQYIGAPPNGANSIPAQFQEGISPGNGPMRGSPTAPVTIVEFTDFQCPYCGQADPILTELLKKHPDEVRLVYRNFPLDIHPDAMNAAMASECANEQGHFWEMYDALFAHQQALGIDSLKQYAKQIGLDTARFTECMSVQRYLDVIKKDLADGQLYGVPGTPTFFANGYRLTGIGSIAAFEQLIAQALPKK